MLRTPPQGLIVNTAEIANEAVTFQKISRYTYPIVKYTGTPIQHTLLSSNKTVSVLLDGQIKLYTRDGNLAFGSVTLDEPTQFAIPNLSSLVFNITNWTVIIVGNNVAFPTQYVLLLHNYNGNLSGKLSDYLETNYDELSYIPSYFVNYLNTQIATSQLNEIAGGNNSFSFVFLTDTHWENNRKHSPALIEEIDKKLNLSAIVHGGDLIVDSVTAEQGIAILKDYANQFATNQLRDKLIYTVGNHDLIVAPNSTPNKLTHPQIYNAMFRHNKNLVLGSRTFTSDIYSGALYGYFDDEYNKVRYISLNCHDAVDGTSNTYPFGFSNTQLDWFGNTALDFTNKVDPTEWSVVVVTHYNYVTETNGEPPSINIDVVYDILASFKAGTPFSLTREHARFALNLSITFDTAINNFICVLGGHLHIDSTFTEEGILAITTRDDGTFSGTEGTTTEQSFDIITVDKTARSVKFTRVGFGDSRTFSY